MGTDPSVIESCTLAERIVLLSIADAEVNGETPVASVDIRPRCRTLAADTETDVVGLPDEKDIMRALSKLGTEPFVEEVTSTTSPTGKGRPRYGLDANVTELLDALSDDARLEDAVDHVRPK